MHPGFSSGYGFTLFFFRFKPMSRFYNGPSILMFLIVLDLVVFFYTNHAEVDVNCFETLFWSGDFYNFLHLLRKGSLLLLIARRLPYDDLQVLRHFDVRGDACLLSFTDKKARIMGGRDMESCGLNSVA